jgi:hypothetical protein
MRRRWKLLVGAVALTVVVAGSTLAAGAISRSGPGNQGGVGASQVDPAATCPPADAKPGQTTQIATAKLIIEYNATDQDIGVHGAFDDHGWRVLCVFDPDSRLVLQVSPESQLRDLTMAGIFFESREPPASEFSFADLEARFPEGEYTVRAESFDGQILVGSATFTHDVPAAPVIESPQLAADPRDAKKATVPLQDLVVSWQDVTETVSGEPVDITGYEVIVTKEGAEDPNGFSQPIYDVHVPPSLNALRVPVEFLEAGTVYELEVLALEASGNQTITVGFSKTAERASAAGWPFLGGRSPRAFVGRRLLAAATLAGRATSTRWRSSPPDETVRLQDAELAHVTRAPAPPPHRTYRRALHERVPRLPHRCSCRGLHGPRSRRS